MASQSCHGPSSLLDRMNESAGPDLCNSSKNTSQGLGHRVRGSRSELSSKVAYSHFILLDGVKSQRRSTYDSGPVGSLELRLNREDSSCSPNLRVPVGSPAQRSESSTMNATAQVVPDPCRMRSTIRTCSEEIEKTGKHSHLAISIPQPSSKQRPRLIEPEISHPCNLNGFPPLDTKNELRNDDKIASAPGSLALPNNETQGRGRPGLRPSQHAYLLPRLERHPMSRPPGIGSLKDLLKDLNVPTEAERERMRNITSRGGR